VPLRLHLWHVAREAFNVALLALAGMAVTRSAIWVQPGYFRGASISTLRCRVTGIDVEDQADLDVVRCG